MRYHVALVYGGRCPEAKDAPARSTPGRVCTLEVHGMREGMRALEGDRRWPRLEAAIQSVPEENTAVGRP
jgi:hypothetical protein